MFIIEGKEAFYGDPSLREPGLPVCDPPCGPRHVPAVRRGVLSAQRWQRLSRRDWVALGIESKTDGRFDDAFSDFEKAAAEGDAAGQCMLGLAYETGEGVAQSWPDAVLLYRAAAGQGHAQAQCNLGWCYEFGKGVPQDAKAAGPLVRRSRPGSTTPGPSAAWPSATPTAPAWQRTPCAPRSCIPYPPRRGLCLPCATLHR